MFVGAATLRRVPNYRGSALHQLGLMFRITVVLLRFYGSTVLGFEQGCVLRQRAINRLVFCSPLDASHLFKKVATDNLIQTWANRQLELKAHAATSQPWRLALHAWLRL
jgi:hypothetical protein